MRAVGLSALVLLASACGPSWTAADAKSATDAANQALGAIGLCTDAAMGCKPEQVRAMERAAYCANASMLVRHGLPAPQTSIACRTK